MPQTLTRSPTQSLGSQARAISVDFNAHDTDELSQSRAVSEMREPVASLVATCSQLLLDGFFSPGDTTSVRSVWRAATHLLELLDVCQVIEKTDAKAPLLLPLRLMSVDELLLDIFEYGRWLAHRHRNTFHCCVDGIAPSQISIDPWAIKHIISTILRSLPSRDGVIHLTMAVIKIDRGHCLSITGLNSSRNPSFSTCRHQIESDEHAEHKPDNEQALRSLNEYIHSLRGKFRMRGKINSGSSFTITLPIQVPSTANWKNSSRCELQRWSSSGNALEFRMNENSVLGKLITQVEKLATDRNISWLKSSAMHLRNDLQYGDCGPYIGPLLEAHRYQSRLLNNMPTPLIYNRTCEAMKLES